MGLKVIFSRFGPAVYLALFKVWRIKSMFLPLFGCYLRHIDKNNFQTDSFLN